jgi:hypothetical protein
MMGVDPTTVVVYCRNGDHGGGAKFLSLKPALNPVMDVHQRGRATWSR